MPTEAAAHVRVQERVDELAALDRLQEPASDEFLRWLHAEFYRTVPTAMLRVRGRDGAYEMMPGQWRSTVAQNVMVGRHEPASSQCVADFMKHFSEKYRLERLGTAMRIIAIPAAHHRFNYGGLFELGTLTKRLRTWAERDDRLKPEVGRGNTKLAGCLVDDLSQIRTKADAGRGAAAARIVRSSSFDTQ